MKLSPELAEAIDEFDHTTSQIGRPAGAIVLTKALVNILDKSEYVILR